ncbi:TetR/AcrR family transcriptional regulator [Patulibacter brassicae]|uniref:TetR/AcrR family transcriptional regulator n=1 Tax=Patulibacter brassicae TaxID=1705717 RepID=A0ABU4VN61_9ACTN|nr:TetR/AcrR family transcriptional regulator [Patulibacter brassicae]MDX8153282.1 TetR/AcrR family transcriptional regulator [Patulibacter brassicae]
MRSVPPSASEKRAIRHAAFRRRLLEGVEGRLNEGAVYSELTVEQIASDAGVSRSTFYLHFRDKSHLLEEFFADVVGDITDAARGWWDLPPDAGYDDVHDAIRNMLVVCRPHAALMSAVTEAAGYEPALRAHLDALITEGAGEVEQHILHGQARGSVRAFPAPTSVAAWLAWTAERGMGKLLPNTDDAALAELSLGLTTIIWSTLYDGTGRPGSGGRDDGSGA